jgi:hypothetical protein
VSNDLRITGTSDATDIAAVLVALATRRPGRAESAYERWRRQRTAALRESR